MASTFRGLLAVIVVGSVLLLAGCSGAPVSEAPAETELPEPVPEATDVPATSEWSAPTAAEFAPQAEEFLDKLVEAGLLSGAVVVARDGEVLFSRGYGVADRERDIPVTLETRFRLGGLSEQFSSLAVLILQDEERLDVQDPVCDYLPECPADWNGLTIHHLLSGASGLGSHLMALVDTRRVATPLPPEDVITLISEQPIRHQPGEQAAFHAWCSDAFLLAQIIETASGVPYDEYMQQEIYEPLGMKDTGPAGDQGDFALPYENSTSRLLEPMPDRSVVAGYASHWSTVGDILRWDQALYSDELITQELADQMFQPQGVFEGEEADFLRGHGRTGVGYAWFIGEDFGRRNYRYWGGTPGTWDYIDRYPDERVTIVILTNQENVDVFTVGLKLASLLFEPE